MPGLGVAFDIWNLAEGEDATCLKHTGHYQESDECPLCQVDRLMERISEQFARNDKLASEYDQLMETCHELRAEAEAARNAASAQSENREDIESRGYARGLAAALQVAERYTINGRTSEALRSMLRNLGEPVPPAQKWNQCRYWNHKTKTVEEW